MKLSIITLALLMATAAFAYSHEDNEMLEGVVTRISPQDVQIQLKDGKSYLLQSAKRRTIEDIQNLESGDLVVGTGKVLGAKKQVMLEDLEMVGVKKVLGAWRESESRMRFEFSNFSSLRISNVDQNFQLNYRLVPDKKDEWTIFLTGGRAVKAGTMTYSPEILKIDIVNLRDGDIVEALKLTPDRKHKPKVPRP